MWLILTILMAIGQTIRIVTARHCARIVMQKRLENKGNLRLVFQRLICFVDGRVVKPPPIKFEYSDKPDGWKYWLDHVRGF